MSFLKTWWVEIAVLQCATVYPCPPEQVGLKRSRRCASVSSDVGLSDHSATIFPSLAAVTLGADVVEVHVTLSREMFGPDVPASITTEELRRWCRAFASSNPCRRTRSTRTPSPPKRADARRCFTKSVALTLSLPPARCSSRRPRREEARHRHRRARLPSSSVVDCAMPWLPTSCWKKTLEPLTTVRRKVCVVITARPSYSRIKTALRAIADHPDLELQLVVAASALLDRYGTASTRSSGRVRIDASVFMVLEGENPTSMAKTTGLGLLELATVFDNLRPDVVVTVADRYETLATAVAAAYMNIPLAHVQGGEVTGSIDEKVRHASPSSPTCTSSRPSRPPNG